VQTRFLAIQEVAEELGVDVQTVRRWIKTGRLRAFKPGREYRIRQADMDEFLEAHVARPKAARRSSDVEPSFNDVLADERRSLADAYLTARREASKLLRLHRRRIDGLAQRWEEQANKLTPEEVRRDLRELEGYTASGIFEVRIPEGLGSLVDTAAIDEAERSEVERIGKAIKRLEEVAAGVIGRAEVDEVLREVERKAPELEAEMEADIRSSEAKAS
jgi:excisionase family DNA binding protein